MSARKQSQNRIGNRWTMLIWVVVFALLLSGCGAEKPKVYRVGVLSGTEAFAVIGEGFKAGMAELGYVEGENIVYDAQNANDDRAEEKRIAEQFVADEVDLIFTFPTEPSVAAQAATQGTDIPVVFAYAGIEGSNLVKSVREPGGNITGVRFPGPEMVSKGLEMLLELAPEVKRLWLGYDENYPNTAPALEALRPLASSRGITLVEVPVTTVGELEADLAARAAADDIGLDAIMLMPDSLNHSPVGFGMISEFAAEQKVLLVGSFPYTVEQGAVFGNANDLFEVGELAAPLADKVLKGTSAGTIPLVTPEAHLWINYRVAQELGLTVPEGMLNQAVKIIR